MRDLVQQMQAGDLDAFGTLVERHQSMVFGTVLAIVENVHDAQDAAQEVFLQAWQDRGYLSDPDRFPAWLCRIARNRSYDLLRRRRSTTPLDGLAPIRVESDEATPHERAERGEMAQSVHDALQSLSEPNRFATTLYYLGGHTIREVAEFLSVPPGTVKRRLHESRKQLKERMIDMVAEHLEANLPTPEFGHRVKERVAEWWQGVDAANRVLEEELASDANALKAFEAEAGDIPDWARSVAEAVPDWGFEACAHRWLDGLDETITMIGTETFHASTAGRCGDIPGYVRDAAEQRLTAVETWLNGAEPEGELAERIAKWLGTPTDEKREAARCVLEILRAYLFGTFEDAQTVAKRWRAEAPDTEVFRWLFLGDGVVGVAENGCGYKYIERLDALLRITGGDYDRAVDVYYSCLTTLRHVDRIDPPRLHVTRGYLWGLYAYLAGHDASWLREQHPECAGAAIHALQGVAQAGAPTPLRRWLVASLFRGTGWMYRRMLNMTHGEDVPGHASNLPRLSEAFTGGIA